MFTASIIVISATIIYIPSSAAEVTRSVINFYSHADGWVFESQPRQTLVIKTGSDSSTTKRSATGVGVIDHRR